MDYSDMIEREKRRRALLVLKLAETDKRIAVLSAMSTSSDPLDQWLDEQTAAPPVIQPPQVGVPMVPKKEPMRLRETPRKISTQWIELIRFLGLDGKDFNQVQEFLRKAGSQMSPGSIRTGLMTYRKGYGLVANPSPGFYSATPKGMAFVESHGTKAIGA
jgi:hypothetical protein